MEGGVAAAATVATVVSVTAAVTEVQSVSSRVGATIFVVTMTMKANG